MLIEQEDGTYLTGNFDVLCVLYDPVAKRYHAAFFEEKLSPGEGPATKDALGVRLKSKMHHTEGTSDLEMALVHLDDLAAKIKVPVENIWREPRMWDANAVACVWLEPNWKKE